MSSYLKKNKGDIILAEERGGERDLCYFLEYGTLPPFLNKNSFPLILMAKNKVS